MAKMCAQVRDEKIEELRQATDIIEVYKGILEVVIFFYKMVLKHSSFL